MYVVTVLFRLHPDHSAAFVPLMVENARTSRTTEPGCQQFDVCRAGDEVFLYEVYEDRTAFDLHLASDHFKAFDAAISGMVADKQVRLFEEVLR